MWAGAIAGDTQATGGVDPSSEPWLAVESYRTSLQAVIRHGEAYLQELASLDDELVVLGQKRSVVVMCAKKIFAFEDSRARRLCLGARRN